MAMRIFTPQYLIIGAALILGAVTISAQDKTIKRVPVQAATGMDGHAMFSQYCAVCHGNDAKGTGPAAEALKKTPADLTQIARKNGGKFPEVHVMRVIHGEDAVAAHGSRDMPIWGELFRSLRGKEDSQLRVNALMKYVESVQAQ